MPLTLLDPHPDPVTPAVLDQLAVDLGMPLPAALRAFLLRHNGGRPEPDRFGIRWQASQQAAAVVGDWSMVAWFYGVHARRGSLAHRNRVTFAGRLPPHTLSFGCDPGGSQLLLRTRGDQAGEVLFWEQEMAADLEEGELPDERNVGFVAPDLDAFLAGLREA